MKVIFQGLILVVILATFATFNENDLHEHEEMLLDKEALLITKMLGCAYITSQAVQFDEDVTQLVKDSVHDEEATIIKLIAEICMNCYRHITEDLALQLTSPNYSANALTPQLKEMIQYNKTRYLSKKEDLATTEEEDEFMSMVYRLMDDQEAGDTMSEEYPDDPEYYGEPEEYDPLDPADTEEMYESGNEDPVWEDPADTEEMYESGNEPPVWEDVEL